MTTAPLPTGPLYTLWKIGGERPDCAFLVLCRPEPAWVNRV
jgi:hypothetical protein